jgi:hypothetical protein
MAVRTYHFALGNFFFQRFHRGAANHFGYILDLDSANVVQVHHIWMILNSAVGTWNRLDFVYIVLSILSGCSSVPGLLTGRPSGLVVYAMAGLASGIVSHIRTMTIRVVFGQWLIL